MRGGAGHGIDHSLHGNTALYRDIHALTVNDVNDINKYEGLFSQASSYQAWFKTRKQVANTMKKAAAKQA